MRQSSIFLFFISEIFTLVSFAIPEIELMSHLDQEIIPSSWNSIQFEIKL